MIGEEEAVGEVFTIAATTGVGMTVLTTSGSSTGGDGEGDGRDGGGEGAVGHCPPLTVLPESMR